MEKITVTNPFDGHLHFRDGEMMKLVALFSARQFSGGIIMPNLTPPITTANKALFYCLSVLEALEEHELEFMPCMALYLTDKTTVKDIYQAHNNGIISTVKLYPVGATTNSSNGISNIRKKAPVFRAMAKCGIPLSTHGETIKFDDHPVDVFDRERVFLANELTWLTETFPDLKIVMEHITTKEAVEFLKNASDNVWATVTAHHLLADRNDMLGDGINPHLYCKPILKRVGDKMALRQLVTSDFKRVGLGTDSAPHNVTNKECSCGCAGVFTAVTALELYAQVFDEEKALPYFSGFATRMAEFYGVKFPFTKTIVLEKTPQIIPEYCGTNDSTLLPRVIPWLAGEKIPWSVASVTVT